MYLFQTMEIYKIIEGTNIMEERKVVLVTEGASGIGFGTIEYLLEQGKYEVISFSRGEKNINLAKEKLKEKANNKRRNNENKIFFD